MEKLNPDTFPMIALYLSPKALSNFIACNSNIYRFFNDVNILESFSSNYLEKWFPNELTHLIQFVKDIRQSNHLFYLKMLCFYVFDNRFDIDNVLDPNEYDPLIYEFLNDRHVDIFKLLIEKGMFSNKDRYGTKPLYHMAGKGHIGICELLIENGVDVNDTSKGGETALHNASYYGRYDICELLIENGVDINIKSDPGGTALGLSRYKGNELVHELLIENGAKK